MSCAVCCQVTFLLLISLIVGFLVGVWLTDEYNIDGLPGLWKKVEEIFSKDNAKRYYDKVTNQN